MRQTQNPSTFARKFFPVCHWLCQCVGWQAHVFVGMGRLFSLPSGMSTRTWTWHPIRQTSLIVLVVLLACRAGSTCWADSPAREEPAASDSLPRVDDGPAAVHGTPDTTSAARLLTWTNSLEEGRLGDLVPQAAVICAGGQGCVWCGKLDEQIAQPAVQQGSANGRWSRSTSTIGPTTPGPCVSAAFPRCVLRRRGGCRWPRTTATWTRPSW